MTPGFKIVDTLRVDMVFLHQMRALGRVAFLMFALFARQAWAEDEDAAYRRPVKVVADARIAVGTQGNLPYAIAGRGEAALTHEGIGVRYVVANPSSYAYFSAERQEPSIAASCLGSNDWKYGMESRPAYLAAPTPGALEQGYVGRRVIYLLGTLDTNPNHPALDKSCMGKAQGPYRCARGHAYAIAMQARDAGTPVVGRAGDRP
jgi:hypothetical protein